MSLKHPAFIAIAMLIAAPVASTAEAEWSTRSVSDFSMFLTLQRFRIYADHCSSKLPQLKPEFDGLMEVLGSHIQGISKSLLSSEPFKGIIDKEVPAEISFAFRDSLDDTRRNFERQDAESICPKTLQSLGAMDDETIRADLMQTLVAVQNMTLNLEKERARQGLPDNRVQRPGSK